MNKDKIAWVDDFNRIKGKSKEEIAEFLRWNRYGCSEHHTNSADCYCNPIAEEQPDGSILYIHSADH